MSARRTCGVEQAGLDQQHERLFRDPTGVYSGLRSCDVVERAGQVHGGGARARGIAPRDRAAQRPVELEHAGPVAKAAQAVAIAGRQARAREREQLARRDVEHVCACARELVEVRHLAVDLQAPAARAQARDQRVGDGLRAAERDRPSGVVPGRGEHQPKRRRRPRIERHHGVGGDAGQQRARRLVTHAAREPAHRLHCRESEAGEQERMRGHPQRPEDHRGELVEATDERREQRTIRLGVAAELLAGASDRTLERDRSSVGEHVRERRRRLHPAQPVAFQLEPVEQR